MDATLDEFLQQNGPSLRVGERQRHFLRKLVDRCNAVICWDGVSTVPDIAVAVMIVNAAPAARIEMLIGALHENSIVIVFGSGNAAFDTLKSRLHAHGSLGADGVDAPHQIWWGSPKPPTVPTGLYRKQDTLFISAYDDDVSADHAALLGHDLQRLGLDHAVVPTPRSGRRLTAASKVDIILQHWSTSCRPVFWIDPHARVLAHPLLPQATDCDFAVRCGRDGAMTTESVFFHQTEEASDLLDIWHRLVNAYPDLPDHILLDQAWTMTCAQRQVTTTWLPESYGQPNASGQRDRAVILAGTLSDHGEDELSLHAATLHTGRRFHRPQAPEAHLIIRNPAGRSGLVTVVVRDTLQASATDVRGSIEAAATAFAADSGGFSQMEIVLCGWSEDIEAVLQIEDHSSVVMTDPARRLQPEAFRVLAESIRGSKRISAKGTPSIAADMDTTRASFTIHRPQDRRGIHSHQSRTVFRYRETVGPSSVLN